MTPTVLPPPEQPGAFGARSGVGNKEEHVIE